MFSVPGVKFLNGRPDYFVVEEIGQISSSSDFAKLLHEMTEYVTKESIPSVNIVLNRKESSNDNYLGLLEKYGFKRYDTRFYYQRDLISLERLFETDSISLKQIDQTTTHLLKKIWQRTVSESLNAPSTLTIEKEFRGMKSELGPDYIESCLIAYKDSTPIGITMPHIEPGTIDEGRMFYFGIVPEYHGKSLGTRLHKLSLQFLRGMGANYYIGATGNKNTPMQRIFEVNGCKKFDEKVTYRL